MTDKEIKEGVKSLSIGDILLLQYAIEEELSDKVKRLIEKARERRGLIVETFNKNY